MARPSVREKLASSAVDTLHAKGFNGCSIQDITDAAGVPKGSFFNHFESKEALAIDALGRYTQNSRLDLLLDKTNPPLERLKNHISHMAEKIEESGFQRGCMLGNLATEMADEHPQMRERLRIAFDFWSKAVESVLREAQAAGDVDPRHDPAQLARFLVNAWEGVIMRLKLTKNRAPIDEFFHICFKVLLK
jgi:TetR/AcrR family transcriptional regulator, transcriptional repressor for nem operon